MNKFKIFADYTPSGDQPTAIETLCDSLNSGHRYQTLLGATGTGKTFTMASVIEKLQRPALVIAHNKTLAAQLCQEFRAFFPENAVNYFISYYDYYQPEAYVPSSDIYIEKDSSVNDEIDRLRHAATQAVLSRRDTIIVASVSCIYGLGSPEEYKESIITFKKGETINVKAILKRLVDMHFTRNELVLGRGTFRMKGEILEIQPADEEIITRIELFGEEIERIRLFDPLTGEILDEVAQVSIFPATHYVTPLDKMDEVVEKIREEMLERVEFFKSQDKFIEAQRIQQRTEFDIEMMKELGYCSGIENYSRYFDGRAPGTPPYSLLDFFPKDFITFIDESHQTLPQIRAMYNGDRQRKETLIGYGFRLPSALDNRPLKFDEVWDRLRQVVYVSATPSQHEKDTSEIIAQQVIRPTGLTDPDVIVRPTKGQIDDLIGEIQKRVKIGERALVTTLTKKMAEDLSEYLKDINVKVQYIHSDVHSLQRGEILRDLRLGVFDVVIGVNLLREGLDLPEVSLVAILDADKEGFLRSETSLIQTIGRAARNLQGQVIMYADRITGSMERAIDETNRRRKVQEDYNVEHDITPYTVIKEVRETVRSYKAEEGDGVTERDGKPAVDLDRIAFEDIPLIIARLEKEMKDLAKNLQFEEAADLRDEVKRLRDVIERTVPNLGSKAKRGTSKKGLYDNP